MWKPLFVRLQLYSELTMSQFHVFFPLFFLFCLEEKHRVEDDTRMVFSFPLNLRKSYWTHTSSMNDVQLLEKPDV